MNRLGRWFVFCCLPIVSILPSGCETFSPAENTPLPRTAAPSLQALHSSQEESPQQVVLRAASPAEPGANGSQPETLPFLQAEELPLDAFVQEVLARNPSLAEMVAAWQAASARYPQATSLEDPMFAATLGPASFGSSTVNAAYRLEISQKYPFPGKLRLKGQNALAEAAAAGNDVEGVRLQLIESAQSAYFDYYLVARALEVNEESLRLLRDFRKNAETRYQTAQGAQQDILQAEVEIGRQRERGLLLERMRQVAIARINTLMNFQPDLVLPPPPKEIAVEEDLQEAPALRAIALAQRPDLKALANRLTADETALVLAYKEYYPDLEPFLMYDRFMGNTPDSRDLATMIGVKVNLPVRVGRRAAAVAEAQARIGQRRAELDRSINQVNFEVQQAYEQVRESSQVVRLYQKEVLPAARSNVKTAQAEYLVGKIPFLSLIEAQRSLIDLQDRLYEATADYFRRRAALERAIGGALPSRRDQ